MAVVETRELRKEFGDTTAVHRIDIRTEEGEFLVLLGPSGCGKTTLLRMIAGLEHPTSGDVLIGGRVVNDLPPRARKIAMVFQSYALYPQMTVFDNIAFPLKAAGVDKAERERRVKWAAELLGIYLLLKRRPRQLSGGERQRVALARAIVREPSVFLLDEPLSNLDAQLRALARDELMQFQRRVQTTTIYVTHDQVEAMGMGDRIAVIYNGRIRQIGTPREIYDEPADTFVATFVGSPPMNLVRRNGSLAGFRPEHFLPVDQLTAEGATVPFDFKVTRVEYLGSDNLIYGLVGETKTVARVPARQDLSIAEGRDYQFAVLERDLKLFDQEGRAKGHDHRG
jgi:multiple sugar transport system ATP-binding protein